MKINIITTPEFDALDSDQTVTVTLGVAAPVVVDPPAPPAPPAPPTITGQTLTADKPDAKVGDIITVTGALNYSDGSTKPVTAYSLTSGNKAVLAPTVANPWTRTFTALTPGQATISNSNSGVYGNVVITVLAADEPPVDSTSSEPVSAPAPAPAPAPSPAPPIASAAASAAGQPVTVIGTLADGTAITLNLMPGQRRPLVSGSLIGSVVYHGDGMSVCVENMLAGCKADLVGDFTITAGTTVLFNGPLTIFVNARTRPFWLAQPQLLPTPDLSLFPKYGAGAGTASMASSYAAADNSPMGYGCADPRMSDEGEEQNLGPLPQWDACYLANPTAENAAVVRGMADSASVWGFHAIDPATMDMLDVTTHPKASMLPACYGAGNPFGPYKSADPKTLSESQAHAPVFCAIACALYGTDYDKEELALWCNYLNSLWQNPGYRLPQGCTGAAHGQIRGYGRGLVVLLYAAKLSSKPDYFAPWIPATAAAFQAKYAKQTGIQVDHDGAIYPNNGFSPWQHDIETYGFGLGVNHGHAEFQWLLDYCSVPIIQSLLDSQHELATIYAPGLKDADGNVAPDFATALQNGALTNKQLAAALLEPEGSMALLNALGDSSGYVAGDFHEYPTSPTGYAAMKMPAIVMIGKHATDQINAQAALAKFIEHQRINGSNNPKYVLAA